MLNPADLLAKSIRATTARCRLWSVRDCWLHHQALHGRVCRCGQVCRRINGFRQLRFRSRQNKGAIDTFNYRRDFFSSRSASISDMAAVEKTLTYEFRKRGQICVIDTASCRRSLGTCNGLNLDEWCTLLWTEQKTEVGLMRQLFSDARGQNHVFMQLTKVWKNWAVTRI